MEERCLKFSEQGKLLRSVRAGDEAEVKEWATELLALDFKDWGRQLLDEV